MSRRFGRNQRRAARERIAELEAKASSLEAKIVEVGGNLEKQLERRHAAEDQLQTVIKNVGAALGRNFIGLPPMDFTLAVREIAYLDSDIGFRMSLDGGRIATMHPVDVAVDEDVYAMRAHVRLKLGPARVGYAISERALLHVPTDALAEQIGHQLARMIVAGFRELKGGRDGR